MPLVRPVNSAIAAGLLSIAPVASASGLGGLSALNLLLFLLLSVVPLALIGAAFVLRTLEKRRATHIATFASVLLAVLFVRWGTSAIGRPLLESLNPWWSGDAAIVTGICLALILGNVLLYVRRRWQAVIAVLAVPVFLALQFVGTPGRSLHYDHDPLNGDITPVSTRDRHHIAWNGRILYSATANICCVDYHAATVEPVGDGVFRVTVSRRNEDPRLSSVHSHREGSRWRYRYPFQPSHVAEVLSDDAVLYDEDWRADAGMLIDVVRTGVRREWLAELAARGADPNHIDANGDTPLVITALRRGANLRGLVEVGADPNLALPGGDRVLHRLARDQPTLWTVARDLIEFGAEPSVYDDAGATPLQIVLRYSRKIGLDEHQRNESRITARVLLAAEKISRSNR